MIHLKHVDYALGHFSELNLSRPLLKAVSALGFSAPTPIQAACIPLALMGRDIVGSAVTGSGKTAAFGLPLLERLLHRNRRVAATYGLVITPTRELAVQVRRCQFWLNCFCSSYRFCLSAAFAAFVAFSAFAALVSFLAFVTVVRSVAFVACVSYKAIFGIETLKACSAFVAFIRLSVAFDAFLTSSSSCSFCRGCSFKSCCTCFSFYRFGLFCSLQRSWIS